MNTELRNKLTKDLERLSNEIVTDKDKLSQFAKQWCQGFHQYSLGNTLLILHQNPKATLCAGYHQWLKHKRYVKMGEHGLAILAPRWSKKNIETIDDDDDNDKGRIYFVPTHTFDVSQTDGEELNIGQSDKILGHCELTLQEIVPKFKYGIAYSQDVANGSTDGKTITIAPRKNKLAEIACYFHELAHCMLHYDSKGNRKAIERETKELEAEAVAFLVCEVVGIDCKDVATQYIGNWNGDKDKMGKCGKNILMCAESIIRTLTDSTVKEVE